MATTRYYFSKFTTTWVNAARYARSSGRTLLEVGSEEEAKQFIAEMKLAGYAGMETKFWIGSWMNAQSNVDEDGNLIGDQAWVLTVTPDYEQIVELSSINESLPFICEDPE